MDMKRKGIALPIEMIVIVAVAVLVLVVISTFFIGGLRPLGQTGDAQAFADGCQQLTLLNCNANTAGIALSNYNEPRKNTMDASSTDGSLLRACYNLGRIIATHPQGYSPEQQCRIQCACPAGSP